MAGDKLMKVGTDGFPADYQTIQASTGAPDAGKVPALDATGKLSDSMMPAGITPDVAVIACTEDLAAGDFVNIYDATGVKCRKADSSGGVAKKADGFVLAGATSGNNATIYFEGRNTQLAGLTVGANYFLSTAGGISATPDSTAAHITQSVGKAISATELSTEIGEPIIRA